MHSETSAAASPTRQRLLDAAARVFARDGLTGATTRAIAEEAGVNEVTLFRHFQSKDRLISAVVGENFGPGGFSTQITVPVATTDLRADLTALARCYAKHLAENLPLVRTMIGESHHLHHCSHERQIFAGIFQPLKEATLARITSAQSAGEMRSDLRPDALSDLFFSTIFTGVLRRAASHLKIGYSQADYLTTAVSVFLDGTRGSKPAAS